MDLKCGIDKAVNSVVDELKKNTRKITTPAETAQVASLAANGDTEVGKMISEGMQKVGSEGVITSSGCLPFKIVPMKSGASSVSRSTVPT